MTNIHPDYDKHTPLIMTNIHPDYNKHTPLIMNLGSLSVILIYLIIFHTDCTLNFSSVLYLIHLHLKHRNYRQPFFFFFLLFCIHIFSFYFFLSDLFPFCEFSHFKGLDSGHNFKDPPFYKF